MNTDVKVIAITHAFKGGLEVLHVLHQNLELAFEVLVFLSFFVVHVNHHIARVHFVLGQFLGLSGYGWNFFQVGELLFFLLVCVLVVLLEESLRLLAWRHLLSYLSL